MVQEVSFGQVDMAAKQGRWGFVSAHLAPFLDEERFNWALGELRKGQNRNSRVLAAIILNRTTFWILWHERQELVAQMRDRMEYHVVRCRIALALYQRSGDPGFIACS